jgi:murein DD-endopeptidase / murein LD-carboxypeptidase
MPNVDLIRAHNESATALRQAVFTAANNWKGTPYLLGGNSKQGIDCSHFVYQVFNDARNQVAAAANGPAPQVVDYRSTATIEASNVFIEVKIPEPTDLVLWDGHVGIVVDPGTGTFVGAQTSTGVAEANYLTGYWKTRGVKKFLRFAHLF